MAFWEVQTPLGGLSLSAAWRGREGEGEGGSQAPLLPPHGHAKVAFSREVPGGHTGRCKQRREPYISTTERNRSIYESAAPGRGGEESRKIGTSSIQTIKTELVKDKGWNQAIRRQKRECRDRMSLCAMLR